MKCVQELVVVMNLFSPVLQEVLPEVVVADSTEEAAHTASTPTAVVVVDQDSEEEVVDSEVNLLTQAEDPDQAVVVDSTPKDLLHPHPEAEAAAAVVPQAALVVAALSIFKSTPLIQTC
jgi:hypothetical protein